MRSQGSLLQLRGYSLEVDLLLVLGVIWFGRHDGDYQPGTVDERMVLYDSRSRFVGVVDGEMGTTG